MARARAQQNAPPRIIAMMRLGGTFWIMPVMLVWQRWASFFRGASFSPTRAQLRQMEGLHRLVLRACDGDAALPPLPTIGGRTVDAEQSGPEHRKKEPAKHSRQKIGAAFRKLKTETAEIEDGEKPEADDRQNSQRFP